jgi:hypothetical protein
MLSRRGERQYRRHIMKRHYFALTILAAILPGSTSAVQVHTHTTAVELQPLAAQVRRVVEALDYLGSPVRTEDRTALERAYAASDAAREIYRKRLAEAAVE